MRRITIVFALCCICAPLAAQDGYEISGYRVVNTYPHDPNAFTQGLLFHNGFLYESTGRPKQSTLRRVDLESGDVIQVIELDDALFAEGLALAGEKLFQLTWESEQAFMYDLATFRRERVFGYSGEGWGLTFDGSQLIKSDGSNRLTFLDATDFRELREIQVRTPSGPIARLNELEYVNGEVWANVWHTDFIVRIDPETGSVVGAIDLAGLLPAELTPDDPEGVLNGIAFDSETGRLFVTGKLWPRIYEIALE